MELPMNDDVAEVSQIKVGTSCGLATFTQLPFTSYIGLVPIVHMSIGRDSEARKNACLQFIQKVSTQNFGASDTSV